MTYVRKAGAGADELVAELEAVPAATLALPDDEVEKLDENAASWFVPIRS